MQTKISKWGEARDGSGPTEILAKLAQDNGRRVAAGIASLTDNSTGASGDLTEITGYQTAFVNAAAVGSDLAGEASSEAVLQVITDGLAEVCAKADAVLVALGIFDASDFVDSTGAVAPDGTIAAIGAATGAATGIQATQTNVIRVAQNDFLKTAALLTNKVCVATGVAPVQINMPNNTHDFTPAVIDETVTGTAADPGVKKTAFDAYAAYMADAIAHLAARLNQAVADAIVPSVVVTDPSF